MKRFRLLIPAGVTLCALMLLSSTAQAQVPSLNQDSANYGLDDIVRVLVYIIKFALVGIGAFSAIFVVIAGYQYILAAGNPEKLEKAKMGLTWSIGGFVLAISSYAIVLLLQTTLGSKTLISQQPGLQNLGLLQNVGGRGVLFRLIQLLLTFGAAVAVLFLTLGGYRYITSQGNQELAEKAKKTILYSVLGLIIIFVSYVVFLLIAQALNVDRPLLPP